MMKPNIFSFVLPKFLLLLFMVSTRVAGQMPTNPVVDKQTRSAIVDSMATALSKYYVYPEKAISMKNYIQTRLKSGAYDTLTNPHALAYTLLKDIRSVQPDKHLIIRFDPALEQRIRDFEHTKQSDKVDREREQKENFFFRKVEILPGNIGYIVFNNFADTTLAARKTVRAAFQFVSHTEGLIIDLRNNFGGNPYLAKEISQYFFAQPTLTGKSFNRLTNVWTEEWIDKSHDLVMQMPVYLLTSERTYSAAEGLAYLLQQVKQGIVIGDTTRGGAHVTRSFSLGNGFVGFIPYGRLENIITKKDWDGTGVIPTVPVAEEMALIKAQEIHLTKQLTIEKDEKVKRKLSWLLNDLGTKTSLVIVPVSQLQLYAGDFEEFTFFLKDGQLYCTNTHQKDKTDKLVPITQTLFKIDNQSQVEFIKNDKGTVLSIRLLWNDGWVDTIKRTK